MVIPVHVQQSTHSPLTFNKNNGNGDSDTQTSKPTRSPLLSAICQALRGQGADPIEDVHATRLADTDAIQGTETTSFHGEELELTWDQSKVVLSSGGVIRRQWNFSIEQEPVQYACIGWLDQSGNLVREDENMREGSRMGRNRRNRGAGYLVGTEDYCENEFSGRGNMDGKEGRPTFGPFSRQFVREGNGEDDDTVVPNNVKYPTTSSSQITDLRVRAVFVFLRLTGHIIPISQPRLDPETYRHLPPVVWESLTDSYTFALPFIVRSAFPLFPHGVLVQRVLEQNEVDEADEAGEEVLPTVFNVISPFKELRSVGVTKGIVNDGDSVGLIDEREIKSGPLKAVPATEVVVWASCRSTNDFERSTSGQLVNVDVIVTVDPEKGRLTLWRYAYLPQKDIPFIGSSDSSNNSSNTKKKRQSLAKLSHGPGHARVPSSGVFSDMVERTDPLEEQLFGPGGVGGGGNMNRLGGGGEGGLSSVPLSALPKMAPALSAATTMESLMSGMGMPSQPSEARSTGDGGFGSQSASQQEKKKKWLANQEAWEAQREKNKAAIGGTRGGAGAGVGRKNSDLRNELSITMDRMALGGKGERAIGGRSDAGEDWGGRGGWEDDRMSASYWMERLYGQEISGKDAQAWRNISVCLFDQRFDGKRERALLAICLPLEKSVMIYELKVEQRDPVMGKRMDGDAAIGAQKDYDTLKVAPYQTIPGVSVAAIRSTREEVLDLLVVKPDGKVELLSHGTSCHVHPTLRRQPNSQGAYVEDSGSVWLRKQDATEGLRVTKVKDVVLSTAVLVLEAEGAESKEIRACFDFTPRDTLTAKCLKVLSVVLPADAMLNLHRMFLDAWRGQPDDTMGVNCDHTENEFSSLVKALYALLGLELEAGGSKVDEGRQDDAWSSLADSPSHARFAEDPVFQYLRKPIKGAGLAGSIVQNSESRIIPPKSFPWLTPVLYALHLLAEDMRLVSDGYEDVLRLCPTICKIASVVRPEWIDFWARLCPTVVPIGALGVDLDGPAAQYLDDRISAWPPDVTAILFGRLTDPDWIAPLHDPKAIARELLGETPSYIYGSIEPLGYLPHLAEVYRRLGDKNLESYQKRAESAMDYVVGQKIVSRSGSGGWLERLPLGIVSPIREAARTCQVAPPGNWSAAAYEAIGRNDLAARVGDAPDILSGDGYGRVKDFVNPSKPRKTITELALQARSMASGEIDAVSGVELDLEDFTSIRFGQDRRLEEVARMLCSSTISNIRFTERPDLNEHDQAREQQNLVVRIAERTLALPYGRAMFTFGSVSMVTREAYAIPKLEYSIRLQPINITVAPEASKISQESSNWGEFHNGVAAALRISSTSRSVESSWIAFNKPSELTPEHAGFLLGLGLTGHLREMLTWHTFSYLTPKHDLTSIGVLLGLAAANVGTGNHHVMKLLAVHTPALLPNPGVDLNVSLVTQAAGLAGVGLLCMGTKNRRMAEVCLGQISRRDLVQPDLTNEHREAYTYSSALAFGMIMLGKGSNVPADAVLLTRLSVLIHGETDSDVGPNPRASFDINLTSPAATIALGLMYLRTERQDVADILTIPDTVLELNRIQPSFLLMRTLARTLIMWEAIAPTSEWLTSQVPQPIAKAMERRFQGRVIDDALELAYYNILAACCFAIGLKYAGTARQEAYLIIISYYDLFGRLVHISGPAFDHKIKRSAIRDGLNIISIALSMVMAGTGEITCLRRLRYAYGIYPQVHKYGVHIATHMSLGLLFLGGGRFTLGTSDAAIACMVAAFFPRTHQISSDNKCYLQALRHLWVLAVEPRCLVARDIDTSEVVYLPVKITMKDGEEETTTQLISPTLIPDLDKLSAIRVDTPRYWPFYLDVKHIPKHRESLLKCQMLYVKRKTAFLSYTEDPRGSRSLFVRSGSSSGDAFVLDFPQLIHAKRHPANDLSEFITSFSNDIRFLAFADHFSRSLVPAGDDDDQVDLTDKERLFRMYCHASLLDCILQDKPRILQAHLTLWQYRTMKPTSKYFHMRLADLRFCADFYGKLYDRRFGDSGADSTTLRSALGAGRNRPPLIRESTVGGALLAQDMALNRIREVDAFKLAFQRYVNGLAVDGSALLPVGVGVSPDDHVQIKQCLAWYLLRHCVPASAVLFVLKDLARNAHSQCMEMVQNDPSVGSRGISTGANIPGPFVGPSSDVGFPGVDGYVGTGAVTATALDVKTVDEAIKTILHATGTKMAIAFGSGWSASSLDDVIAAWGQS